MATGEYVLRAAVRDQVGKGPARRLRGEGMVPVVVYSHGNPGRNLTMNQGDLVAMIHHAGLLTIKVEKERKPITAVIKDYQLDVLRGHLRHVDFQEVRADEVIGAAIPLRPHGEPKAEAQGGIVDQVLHELDVRCPANKLPEELEIDISGLDIDDTMTAGEIVLPEDVELDIDPETIVFSVYIPREEEAEEGGEEAVAEGEEGAEPEVIGKGRPDEEEEEQ